MKTLFFSAWLISWVSVYGQQANPKRGISFGTGNPKVADVDTIAGKLSWVYNWGPAPDATIDPVYVENNIEFVPMAWNGNFNKTALRQYYSTHPEVKYLLGFNEPNFKAQANMKPSEAAAKWPELEAIATEFGLKIVGPAVNWCGTCVSENGTTYYSPYDYLDDFFAACPNCQVDYIAVHNYMCYSGSLIDYLEGFKKYNKKIWLTEFACWDQATITLDMQKNLMIGALDYMDNDTMIYRYAWFIGRAAADTPDITLFDDQPGKLTELGQLYLNYQAVHDTAIYTPVPGRIEAESYSAMQGISLEMTSDFDGIANVGYIDAGDWLQYNVDATQTSDYYLYLRLASSRITNIQIFVDDTLQSTLEVPSTSGYQNWKTIKTIVSLNQGHAQIKLVAPSGGFNINWLAISMNENHAPVCNLGDDKEVILPFNSIPIYGNVTDADGNNLQFKWKKVTGPSCNIDDENASDILVTNMVKGTYTFRLTAFDGFETSSDDIKVKVTDGVGVGQDNEALQFSLYPMPANQWVNIQTNISLNQGMVELYQLSGQKILSQAVQSLSGTKLDVSSLENGVYILKLVYGGNTLAISKMVIAR